MIRKVNTGRRKYAANKVLAAPAECIVMPPEPSALILEVRKEGGRRSPREEEEKGKEEEEVPF